MYMMIFDQQMVCVSVICMTGKFMLTLIMVFVQISDVGNNG